MALHAMTRRQTGNTLGLYADPRGRAGPGPAGTCMTESQTYSRSSNAECDREPIHVPGSIQPHGVLLAARPDDLTVVQVGGDTHS